MYSVARPMKVFVNVIKPRLRGIAFARKDTSDRKGQRERERENEKARQY